MQNLCTLFDSLAWVFSVFNFYLAKTYPSADTLISVALSNFIRKASLGLVNTEAADLQGYLICCRKWYYRFHKQCLLSWSHSNIKLHSDFQMLSLEDMRGYLLSFMDIKQGITVFYRRQERKMCKIQLVSMPHKEKWLFIPGIWVTESILLLAQ